MRNGNYCCVFCAINTETERRLQRMIIKILSHSGRLIILCIKACEASHEYLEPLMWPSIPAAQNNTPIVLVENTLLHSLAFV